MESSARESYFTTEVMTATPQRLQLMLIEAVIRLTQRARERRRDRQNEAACEDLIRAQEIVTQILASLNPQADASLAKKVASVYLFVFRALMEANLMRDEGKLDEALRVLEIERQTWRQVCLALGAGQSSAGPQDKVSISQAALGMSSPPIFVPSIPPTLSGLTEGGVSLEA